jgi:F-type H+-transporting ATPase subunit epsilon
VLKDHAPIVTALDKGNVRYVSAGKEQFVAIKEGFAEVKNNVVTVCAEV